MPALKCPTPDCSFRFDPARVPEGVTLLCRKCGRRFSLAEAIDATEADAPPVAAVPLPRGLPSVLSGPLAVVGLLALLAVVGVAVTFALIKGRRPVEEARPAGPPELKSAELNFRFALPEGWQLDEAIKNDFAATALGLKRAEAPAAFGLLSVTDYLTREPTLAEVRADALRKLDRVFTGVPRDLKLEPATWGGRPAARALFRGVDQRTDKPVAGELTVAGYRGVGYWFCGYAAEADAAAVAGSIEAARESLRIGDDRANWRPKAVAEESFRSVKPVSVFRLSGTDPAWKRDTSREPSNEHPLAELLLKAVLKGGGAGDVPPTAQAVVIVLPAEGELGAQLDALVKSRHVRDPAVFGPTAVEPVAEPAPAEWGAPAGGLAVKRVVVRSTEPGSAGTADLFLALAAKRVGTSTVVAEASCALGERAIWEERLVRLVLSLRGAEDAAGGVPVAGVGEGG